MEQLWFENAASRSERSSVVVSARGSRVTTLLSEPRASEHRLRRIAEHIQRLENNGRKSK
jgi:hypothetical protein